MKNLPKDKRDRLILIAVGTLAVTVGLWYGVVNSMRSTRNAIAQQIKEQQNKVGAAERLVNSTAQMQDSLEQALAKLKTVEQTMASGDMYSWIILTVNKFRADRRVEIPQFSREVTSEVGLFPKFPYKAATFTVRGTAFFHDLGKFIADFENAFPHVRVQNLELEPATVSNATGASHAEMLSFKMEIVTLINPNTL